ncbi:MULTISPECIES: amidohydrolase [Virgibacillus]|uniref:p-aminobenzoyl-glutamate hydrolase subunit B n=2 Tax=Virgibacillus TaxID=84406 RepID=A0A024QHP4_9BACI|nr:MULTISPECIES: amidohydrolase [Virgibacillus]EQB36912.1 hypothetical protein M948_10825 [Virgibacillus sp. CM-4]MYL43091.1 amidohydrolase [Virgibacillus massiliensis]GGJ65147.1 glutamate carboxypeptidase [Virgibacillus kapii]CDQ41999.1 p-aminobenzoyl-glutamate hydrolase subunit B [Virgibacillus massiliensis]
MAKNSILDWLDEKQSFFSEIANDIWDHPQLAYEETYAATLQMDTLRQAGFTIKSDIAGIPTAFVAEFGNSQPIIGVLGEYDALPGLSQKKSTTRQEINPNGPGHGCGHNLLGTAGVEAVIALKTEMENNQLSGTIRYYGCPAEEVLSGKTFMAKEGVFDDLDCALTWHPGTSNITASFSMQAMVSIKFHFKGITAHAAGAPHAGRSALDAVELMNVGANYMREHTLDGSRIHYVISNGGLAPNVVPDNASVWYYLRAASKAQVEQMLRRIRKIAQGAALMTETEVSEEMLANAYDTLPNNTLNDLMYENMITAGSQKFSLEEDSFANDLVATVDQEIVQSAKQSMGVTFKEHLPEDFYNLQHLKGTSIGGSTDVGDVSWITPVGQIMTTCAPIGVQPHSWQATASYGSSIGLKGMHLAAKSIALTLYDLITNESVIDKARNEFEKDTNGKGYTAGIPDSVQPPVLPVPNV